MAVAFDAFSSSAQGTGTLSWTHTPVGVPKAIIVLIVQHANGTDQVSGVTYGGVAMVEHVTPNLKTSGENGAVYVYRLLDGIPPGAQTVEVTVSGANQKRAGAISLTGLASTSIVQARKTINNDLIINPSETMTPSGNMMFCCIGFYSGQGTVGGIAPLTGWTNRLENDFGVAVGGWYTYNTIDDVDVTSGWTQTGDDALAISVSVTQNKVTADHWFTGISQPPPANQIVSV